VCALGLWLNNLEVDEAEREKEEERLAK